LIEVKDQRDEVRDVLLDNLEENLKKCLCRRADIVLRRKREKLLAALCEADLKAAQAIHRRIEETVLKNPTISWDSPPVIKVGMATYPEEAISKRELFRIAKERLGG
jgi:GGDEF domain-containing protein